VSDRQPIDTAPRDGRTIIVGHDDMGEYVMRWVPDATSEFLPGVVGLWVTATNTLTWVDGIDNGPSYWRNLNS
jgi:hypothetical protein